MLVMHQGAMVACHGHIRTSIARYVVYKAEILVSYMFYLLKFYFGYNDIHIGFRNRHIGDVVRIIVFSQF
jgi:hypothetical protein